MNNGQQNILKVLAYFDVFNYPLLIDEIKSFLLEPTDQSSFEQDIAVLITEKTIFKFDEFYSLQNDRVLVDRRCKGNRFAEKQMATAAKAAAILSRFPYVRALAISGSLSKNFSDEKADVDFFIITAANRLWIARTIMHLFKKLTFVVGKQNWFCMNYYVDESMMEIPEKNIFTAMEIVTLIPMYGNETFPVFYNNNQWIKNYFPGRTSAICSDAESKEGFFKKIIEKLFNGKTGDALDDWLMKLTDKRWQKKTEQNRINARGITMTLNANKHFSKPDPRNFQSKVVQQYENKLGQLALQK
ncbi:MAG TPA: hypothetical protein VK718_12405 [Ferruginibacter sp.]|nr:hypothetical protein [Ferruginibacter sp.]